MEAVAALQPAAILAAGLMPLTTGKRMTSGQTAGVTALHASSLTSSSNFVGMLRTRQQD